MPEKRSWLESRQGNWVLGSLGIVLMGAVSAQWALILLKVVPVFATVAAGISAEIPSSHLPWLLRATALERSALFTAVIGAQAAASLASLRSRRRGLWLLVAGGGAVCLSLIMLPAVVVPLVGHMGHLISLFQSQASR